MRKKLAKLQRAVVAGAVSAVVAGIAVASSGTAQAAEPGTVKVCNGEDFQIKVIFDGGYTLKPSWPNPTGRVNCLVKTNFHPGSGNVEFKVYNGKKYLGAGIYNEARGAEILGTPGPSFVVS